MDPRASCPSASESVSAVRVRTRPWLLRIALGLALWLVYTTNGREVGAGDTVPAVLLPIGIARGDGLVLDRFEPVLRGLGSAGGAPGRFPPYYVSIAHGHLWSRFTVLPAIVSLPLVLPQIALLDAARPGWDATPASTLWHGRWMAKNASAAIAALTAVLLLEVLRRLGLGRVALPATLVAALGSPLWTIAAQSPWHHGPTALALTTAIGLLLCAPRPGTLAAAGVALGVLVGCRPPAMAFALPLAVWAVRRRPGDAYRVLPPLAIVGALVAAYNVAVFGTPIGGQSELEVMRLPMHAVSSVRGDLAEGIAGTLLSPSRGLFVFCPWVVATILAVPRMWRRLARAPMLPGLVVGLGVYLVVFAQYSAWWAGWCFGPRYWTEAVPVLAILYAFALDATRAPLGRGALYALGAAAVAIQAVGAACYPSTWNAMPVNVDLRHERLWDWRDSELTRELREGPRPREFGLGPW